MVKLGLVSATFKNLEPSEVISLAVKAGLGAIEWSEKWHIAEGDTQKAKEILSLTLDAGLEIVELGSYYRMGLGQDIMSRIALAKALKTNRIRIWAGDRGSKEYSSDERKALVKEAKEISGIAMDEGIEIVTEWHKNTLTDLNESALNLFKEVDMPNFKTLWQPTQALSVSERVEGLKMIPEYLTNIHVYYWDESGRRPLKEGRDNWREYMSAISGDHCYLLEFVKDDSINQFLSDAEELKSWFN